jgi:PAS domain S-box-containing protein
MMDHEPSSPRASCPLTPAEPAVAAREAGRADDWDAAPSAPEPEVRAALELMPQLVWTTTPDGYHDYYNARWYDYTGMPRPGDPEAHAEGWNWKTYLHPDDHDRTVAVWAECLASGAPYEIEYRFREAATGTYRWFLGRALPLRDTGVDGQPGRIVRWFGTCTDVDDQRRDADQRRAQAAELEATNRQLQEQQAVLEAQAEALRVTAARLAERTEAAEEAEHERARLLDILAAERDRLAALIRQMPAPLCLFEGPDLRFAVQNDAFTHVIARGRDLTGLTSREAFPELEGAPFHDLMRSVYTSGVRWVGPETLVRFDRDGSGLVDTWFDLSYQAVRNAGGQITGVLQLAVDVTHPVRARREIERLLGESERARADAEAARAAAERAVAALAESEQRFRLVADAVPQIVWITDPDGRVEFFNRQWTAYTGAPYEPTTAAQVAAAFVHPDDGPATAAAFDEARRTGGVFTIEHRIRSAAGDYRWFLVRAEPYRDGTTGEIVRWFGASVDIDDRKRAESERERLLAAAEAARTEADVARRAAETANRAKGEFLAVMSHELRTPLNAIGGYAELIELGIRGPVTAEQRADLARIQASQRHLLGLINGVLNYSRAEAGVVYYEMRDVTLAPLLATCETLIATQARAKEIALRFGVCDDRLSVRADAEKAQQIILNLLSNAVKFTARGGEVAVACLGGQGPRGGGSVVVTVRDTGRGIAADEIERVFEPFVQVDTRLTRTEEGMGLGLAISRDLARGMGGDLTAVSTLGVGSTFTLVLPAA